MKTTIIIISIVAIALIGYFGFKYYSNQDDNRNVSSEETNSVQMKNLSFIPNEAIIEKGDTVTWKNEDTVDHTIKFENLEDESGFIKNVEGFSVTFPDAGTFEYYCTIHPFMKGKITVRE